MIIATMIFLTASTGLTYLWIQYARSMSLASSQLVGQFIGEELMEECMAARYQLVDGLAGTNTVTMTEVVRGETKNVDYTTNVTVNVSGGVKVVTVDVSWVDGEGTSRIQYKTVLTPNG